MAKNCVLKNKFASKQILFGSFSFHNQYNNWLGLSEALEKCLEVYSQFFRFNGFFFLHERYPNFIYLRNSLNLRERERIFTLSWWYDCISNKTLSCSLAFLLFKKKLSNSPFLLFLSFILFSFLNCSIFKEILKKKNNQTTLKRKLI
jgi:hypothetical protein